MATLADLKIVDLKKSVLDKEKTDPKKNRYVFIEKKYVNKETYIADNIWFSWCHYNPKDGLQMVEEWKLNGWDYVRRGEDPYLVEGATPHVDGYWTYKDVVLMKCKFDEEAARGEERIKLAGGGKKRLQAFAKEIDYMEPAFTRGAGIGPDEMQNLAGGRYKR